MATSKQQRQVVDMIPPDLLDDDRPAAQLCAKLIEAMIDELGKMSGTWKQLSKTQQDVSIERLRSAVYAMTQEAIETIAREGCQSAAAKIESITIKDGAKATIKLLSNLTHAIPYVGRQVMLVFTDAEKFQEGAEGIEGDADQASLDLGGDDQDDEAAPEPQAPDAGGPGNAGEDPGELPDEPERIG